MDFDTLCKLASGLNRTSLSTFFLSLMKSRVNDQALSIRDRSVYKDIDNLLYYELHRQFQSLPRDVNLSKDEITMILFRDPRKGPRKLVHVDQSLVERPYIGQFQGQVIKRCRWRVRLRGSQ